MEPYIDGFVLPVKKERIGEYKRIVESTAQIWKEHGALEYLESIGDDLGTDKGNRSFREMLNASEDEIIVFGWVVFASREARDATNKRVETDPRMAEIMDPEDPIFDINRMAYGGFKTLTATP